MLSRDALLLELAFFIESHQKIGVIGCDAFDVLVIGIRSKLILQKLKQNMSISINLITDPHKYHKRQAIHHA